MKGWIHGFKIPSIEITTMKFKASCLLCCISFLKQQTTYKLHSQDKPITHRAGKGSNSGKCKENLVSVVVYQNGSSTSDAALQRHHSNPTLWWCLIAIHLKYILLLWPTITFTKPNIIGYVFRLHFPCSYPCQWSTLCHQLRFMWTVYFISLLLM